jgi:hypothetical protein
MEDTAKETLLAFAMAAVISLALIAKERCWVQLPSVPVFNSSSGSPTLIEE